ncbi:hypothetical protein Srufu_007840 [Streptomyces libani subsp. rufus]|nr:hypothetical protein Srufu_007840 [Streptomyces libani subsp. rufus]
MNSTSRATAPTLAEKAEGVRAAANTRLTALAGVLLLALLAAQLVTTLLGVRNQLTAHVAIGLVLTPVVALKLGTTGWRMVMYYRGDPEFRRLGPPQRYFRVLGPILTVLTLMLLGSGLLVFLGPTSAHHAAMSTHATTFYLWLVAVTLHAGPHYLKAVRLAAADIFARINRRLPGAGSRLATVLASGMGGALLALTLISQVTDYLARHPHK